MSSLVINYEALNHELKIRGVKYKDVAKLLGYTPQNISYMLRGKIPMLNENLFIICNKYEIKVKDVTHDDYKSIL